MFEQETYYKQKLKVKHELSEYEETVLLGYYVDEYVEKMG